MDNKHFLDINQFQQLEKIGKGQFGVVYKIKDKISGIISAAKISINVIELTEDNESLIKSLVNEVNIISKLNHPSIVKFIGFSRFDFHGFAKPVIITEIMTGGSLSDLINLERRGCSKDNWNDTRKLITLYGIAVAMMYLHSHNIIHRDLKPQNILMDDQLYPKIADFGLSKILHKNEDSMSAASIGGFKGTFLYSPPEVLTDDEYTMAGDVYAFGMIAFEVITNEEPFKNCSFFELSNKVSNGIRPKFNFSIPESYQEMIEKCWSQDQKDRPSFEDIAKNLKNNKDFITETVDEVDFINYVDYIDDCKITFENGKPFISIDEFIKQKSIKEIKNKEKITSETKVDENKKYIKKRISSISIKINDKPINPATIDKDGKSPYSFSIGTEEK